MNRKAVVFTLILIAFSILFFLIIRGEQFKLPKGETTMIPDKNIPSEAAGGDIMPGSNRQIFVTDGVKHSIPLDEILSGGVSKDGIPSIDNPKFISVKEADEFLKDSDVGLGFIFKGEARFYPYQILVFHEIVNDTIQSNPILVTYCPLCATGIVFERRAKGETAEFGVSGKLWQSNLLMYNRPPARGAQAGSPAPDKESLWSQVLGEAVLGEFTGEKLKVLRSDTLQYGSWKSAHPDTLVLSKDTGAVRSYGQDPYGDYYTSAAVSFGAAFNDKRLHPKAFVLGIEVDGAYKAYEREALKVGTTIDSFEGAEIVIVKDEHGIIEIFIGEDRKPLLYIGGFWFSWLAVHPETELYK